jgi:RND family efflux transporter MFP subunit
MKRFRQSLSDARSYVCVLLLAFSLAACGDTSANQQKGPPPTQVATYKAQAGEATYFEQYPATVVALNQVEIRPEVSGYLTHIYFKDGQHVRKGAKLYEIDQQQYRAAYDQAVANLNVAKANYAKLQQDAARYEDLAKQDAIARQTLDHARADMEAARMQVAAVEANLKNIETNFRNSVIYAPFDCTIGITQVQVGSAVTAGQTLLNTVSSDDPMAADCDVDEKQINRFSGLLEQPPPDTDSTFTLSLPDQSVYAYPGRLILIDRAINPQTGTIRIRLTFPNPHRALKPGLNCNLRVRTLSSPNTVLIPYRSVVEQMGEYHVFVVNGDRVSERKIGLGRRVSDKIIVKEGVNPGEQVVVEGTQRLKDSSLVAVVPPKEQGASQPPQGGR